MFEQPEVTTASDVALDHQQQENIKTSPDADVYADDDPFAELAVDENEQRQFTFSTQFEDEEKSFSATEEANAASAPKSSDLKPSSKTIGMSGTSTPAIEAEETPKETEVSLSPRTLPDITTPHVQLSPRLFEGDDRKETQTIYSTDTTRVHSPYGSVGLLEDNYAARSSYELLSHGSRTTMIIHFSPSEVSESGSMVESAEEMRDLEISGTCASTCYMPEVFVVSSRKESSFDLSGGKASQLDRLEKEGEADDQRITEIFAYLRSMLESDANPKALENLITLEQAFAKKGDTKRALSNERDHLVAMHMNFVSRVAEEMSNMKMNPRGWVSLS